jgi:hypothetical protein
MHQNLQFAATQSPLLLNLLVLAEQHARVVRSIGVALLFAVAVFAQTFTLAESGRNFQSPGTGGYQTLQHFGTNVWSTFQYPNHCGPLPMHDTILGPATVRHESYGYTPNPFPGGTQFPYLCALALNVYSPSGSWPWFNFCSPTPDDGFALMPGGATGHDRWFLPGSGYTTLSPSSVTTFTFSPGNIFQMYRFEWSLPTVPLALKGAHIAAQAVRYDVHDGLIYLSAEVFTIIA